MEDFGDYKIKKNCQIVKDLYKFINKFKEGSTIDKFMKDFDDYKIKKFCEIVKVLYELKDDNDFLKYLINKVVNEVVNEAVPFKSLIDDIKNSPNYLIDGIIEEYKELIDDIIKVEKDINKK